jgi:UrcA family protein
MSLSAVLVALALSHTTPPPEMRVEAADLDLMRIEDRATFRTRLTDAAGAFCDQHRALVTPAHIRARGWCEQAISAEALSGLPADVRREFRRDRQAGRGRQSA